MAAKSKTAPKPLWTPSYKNKHPLDAYREHINSKFGQSFQEYFGLYDWSITNPQEFWTDLYQYLEVVPPLPSSITIAYDESRPMSSSPPFFEGHRINYAENMLANADRHPDRLALIGLRESQQFGTEEKLTWAKLRERVRLVQSAMKRSGLKEGERVAALVSNSVWAIVLFLATTSMGAIYTVVSPDLGVEGCVSRLQQTTPTLLFADADNVYKGRQTSTIPKISSMLAQLQYSRPREVFLIPIISPISRFSSISEFLSRACPSDQLTYKRVSFNDPMMICYSSGTTGQPKCIVHHHGTILNNLKISRLSNGLQAGEMVFQFTSTSWIMFYIQVGHLSTGATCLLYDGSPFYPDVRTLLRVLEHYRVTFFGTSPRFLLELEINKVQPQNDFNLSALRMVNTTGASLSIEQYRWFYNCFPSRIHLCNVAGGTDTATTLLGANPIGPLYPGEMQCFALGMAVDIADPETGASLKESGKPGELVIRKPFPSMPPFFWGDRDGSKYHSSYFERFEGVDCWAQHDWVTWNPVTRGAVMSGRSDGVLNPSGVRFGSGEIYAISEGPLFNSEIAETLCIGRRRPQDADETVFLFVKMIPGKHLTDGIVRRMRKAISKGLSPRHVPRFVIEIEELPVTINGKKVEIAVKQIVSGNDIKISSTVANPECLKAFVKFRNLEEKREARL